MSAFINSLLIEPVVRQARRFSSSSQDTNPARPLSHAQDNATVDQALLTHDVPHMDPPLQSDNNTQSPLESNVSRSAGPLLRDEAPRLDVQQVSSSHVLDQQPVSSPISTRETAPGASTTSSRGSRASLQERTLDGLGSMSLEDDRDMTQNPSFGVPLRVRDAPSHRNSIQSAQSRSSIEVASNRASGEQPSPISREGSVSSLNMSALLPGDDGMKPLREKIHLIRDMALSSEEKARRMHALMVADYEAYRATAARSEGSSKGAADRLSIGSRHSQMASLDGISYRSPTPISTTSIGENDEALFVSADDLKPTYQPRSKSIGTQGQPEPEASSEEEEELSLGCKHYQRNVKIQCGDCSRWYTCRHCHDDNESHLLNRKTIGRMLCMLCGHAQKAGEYCEKCGDIAAAYYCDICHLWENDPNKKIYHCVDCGICRRGEGLGKDFVHCKKCNVCIAIAWISRHRCVERATECDCPICNDWMFTSSAAVVAMQCGHYIHRKCYDDYMHTSYKCPICNRSAVNMELQWRKLDQAIEAQKMPSQFAETKAWINCNDCAARSCTSYHWLGNKCTVCDSYNTNYTKLVNSPTDRELEEISNSEQVRALRAAEQNFATSEANTGPLPRERIQQSESTEAEASLSAPSDIVARSADSPAPTQDSLFASPELPAPHQALPQSPTDTSSTMVGSPAYQPFIDPRRREHSLDGAYVRPEHHEDGDEGDDEDDVGFWGEGISPSSWSMPMGISPMGAWTSPSFFATRMEARNGEANREDAEEEEDEGAEEGGESSTDDSEDDEAMELDEDGDIDEIELLGHR